MSAGEPGLFAGVVLKPNNKTTIRTNFSTAFRAPNIDDIGKVFDSEPGNVIVPNENLKSEKILVRRREDGKIIERKDLIEKIDYIIEVKRRIKYNINLKVGLESILFYMCE